MHIYSTSTYLLTMPRTKSDVYNAHEDKLITIFAPTLLTFISTFRRRNIHSTNDLVLESQPLTTCHSLLRFDEKRFTYLQHGGLFILVYSCSPRSNPYSDYLSAGKDSLQAPSKTKSHGSLDLTLVIHCINSLTSFFHLFLWP